MKRLLTELSLLFAIICISSCLQDPGRVKEYARPNEPDLHGIVDDMEISSYFAENPYADKIVKTLMSEDRIIDEFVELEAAGYRFEPSASLVSEAKTKEGENIRLTILALESREDPQGEAVFLFNVRGNGIDAQATAHYAFHKEAAGPQAFTLDDVVWIEIIVSAEFSQRREAYEQRFDWRNFARCSSQARLNSVESLVAELSPALGVHTGPGTMGLCYYPLTSEEG